MGKVARRGLVTAIGIAVPSAALGATPEDTPVSPREPERPRLELGALAGFSTPNGEGTHDVGSGPSAGATALYRPIPALAFGALFDVTRFPWLEGEHIVARTYGAALRVYTYTPPWGDVYLGGFLGRTDISASRTGAAACNTSGSLTLGALLGADRFVSSSLRLGGQVGYHGDLALRICTMVRLSPDAPRAAPHVVPGLTFRLTGTFGAG